LIEQPPAEMMFHDSYAFFSGTSQRMTEHFKGFADEVISKWLSAADPFVVEVGSNDGIMMQHFANAGIRHLGVEPSKNVAEVARKKGINTVSRFFDDTFAQEIIAEYGQADAFLGANVMCHISNFNSVIAGIKRLLKPKGVLVFEDPYLGDVIEKTSYDQIYDEHVFLFSVMSVKYAFAQHDMQVIHVAPQETHGGSMRYYVSHRGAYEATAAVQRQFEKEQALGLDNIKTFERFRLNCERSRDALQRELRRLKSEGKRVVGYGATSKSTTVTNYCKITPDLVEFISDTTPIKQGKFSPGVHIPVRSYEEFTRKYPDVALLFAWNHSKEIMAKENKFLAQGGRWLVYVPEVNIVSVTS
jgi:methylation protein EvaC